MKKYGNDYRQNGKQFEYTGKWHSTKAEAKELKQYAWSYTGLMIAAMIVYVAGLMINNAGSRVFWVLIPFVTMIFPISYGIMGGVSLLLFCRNQEGKGQTSQVVIPEEHVGHDPCTIRKRNTPSGKMQHRNCRICIFYMCGRLDSDTFEAHRSCVNQGAIIRGG